MRRGSGPADRRREWLEADGQGGFASGTVAGVRTRRYHALLLAATTPPTGRVVLVNGIEAWVEEEGRTTPLTTQHYLPDVTHPDGHSRLVDFRPDPWPTWRWWIRDGVEIVQEILVPRVGPGHGKGQEGEGTSVAIRWRLEGESSAALLLKARPLLSGRDMHALHHENGEFRFDGETVGDGIRWRPYAGLPAVFSHANGSYAQDPIWYRSFLYEEERARGLDHVEDLASPGVLTWELVRADAVWILSAGDATPAEPDASRRAAGLRDRERRRRRSFASPLHRAGDAYLVRRGDGATIIAGYPWFGDWGRDTFIALRGLCLATGRLVEASQILTQWADAVSEGMLPNRFVEQGDAPEFNSVDAALWYVIAVDEFFRCAEERGLSGLERLRPRLEDAVDAILGGYATGTRHGIRVDDDGLLAAGAPGLQLTWMDAKVGDWVVTPRIGKPVELQGLWINALAVGRRLTARWGQLFRLARATFPERFWNAEGSYLFDVVDVDHERGALDWSFRPNQVFAVGGLPIPLLDKGRARAVVDAVEHRLWTPLGLRSLAPDDPAYRRRYEGGIAERDGAYHQGTVWPWLIGPFVEAWLRVRGGGAVAREEARCRFLAPILAHLDEAGLGHVSEIADAEPPHAPRGCPFQAWSVAEALRLSAEVLAEPSQEAGAPGGAPEARFPSARADEPDEHTHEREGVTA